MHSKKINYCFIFFPNTMLFHFSELNYYSIHSFAIIKFHQSINILQLANLHCTILSGLNCSSQIPLVMWLIMWVWVYYIFICILYFIFYIFSSEWILVLFISQFNFKRRVFSTKRQMNNFPIHEMNFFGRDTIPPIPEKILISVYNLFLCLIST